MSAPLMFFKPEHERGAHTTTRTSTMSDEATIAIEEASDRGASGCRLTIDLVSSYALSLSRVAAWAIVSTIVVHQAGIEAFALIALVRGTLNLISYVPTAITPPLVHAYLPARVPVAIELPSTFETGGTIDYRSVVTIAGRARDFGEWTALAFAVCVCVLGGIYRFSMWSIHALPSTEGRMGAAELLTLFTVFAIALRVMGEPAAARLQARRLLSIDNFALLAGEWIWPFYLASQSTFCNAPRAIEAAGLGIAIGQLATLFIRTIADRLIAPASIATTSSRVLIVAIATLYLGQLADYLYGSTNQILIDRHLGHVALAAYVPCLQIDGGLLLIVSGIGVALFPRIARDTRAKAFAAIRRDYLVGTIVSLSMLAIAAILAWLLAPFAIRHWLGVIPAGTLAILPLVLVHTVVGGTAGIGRAVLLGMGRFKAYTISALVGGVANVALALLFVLGFGWGLRGVVFATIVAVVGRCAIWMPWYILRALRAPPAAPLSGALAP